MPRDGTKIQVGLRLLVEERGGLYVELVAERVVADDSREIGTLEPDTGSALDFACLCVETGGGDK